MKKLSNTNTDSNSTIITLVEPLASKLNITAAAYYTALVDALFGGINEKRKERNFNKIDIQTAQIVRLITRCKHYGINPLLGHVYAMEHNNIISYDLTINGWLYVLQNNENFKNYSTVYSDSYVDSKVIEGHKIPEWIRADIEFKDGRIFQGIRCYYLEEAEPTSAWDKRPARILAGRAIAQATRFGLNISIDDTDIAPEYDINVDQKPTIKFDDDETESNQVDSNTEAEAETKRLADEAEAKAEAETETKNEGAEDEA
ncbi:hypothetical protein C9J21_18390, partial [Photobacterium phosphoreum]|uniref:hypothetical protein n=1 Tax=Photobacterium phosphoreum TaxID=659 RepID=UPI000D44C3BD